MSTFALLRYQRIWDLGCICCSKRGWYSPCEVHHLNLDGKAGQKRRGDEYTIGLCKWHHQGKLSVLTRGASLELLGPPLTDSRAFRRTFGTDDELLDEQNRMIASAEARVVGKAT
jgi:hypothetical protein